MNLSLIHGERITRDIFKLLIRAREKSDQLEEVSIADDDLDLLIMFMSIIKFDIIFDKDTLKYFF